MNTTVTGTPVSAITGTPIPDVYGSQRIWLNAFRKARVPGHNGKTDHTLKSLGYYLATYMNPNGYTEVAPGTATIAEDHDWSRGNRNAVNDRLHALEASGWLVRVSGKTSRTVNHYQACVPAALFDAIFGEFLAQQQTADAPVALPVAAPAVVVPLPAPVPAAAPAPPVTQPGKTVFEVLGAERHAEFVSHLAALREALDRAYPGRNGEPGEGSRLFESVKTFGMRVDFAVNFMRLLDLGWGDAVWEALTDCESDRKSPYGGANNVAAIAWTKRLKPLADWKGNTPNPVTVQAAGPVDGEMRTALLASLADVGRTEEPAAA